MDMIKIIMTADLIYQIRAIDPDQAEWLARRNGTLSAETFTLKYDKQIMRVGNDGLILPPAHMNLKSSTIILVTGHLIYEARPIPLNNVLDILDANNYKELDAFKKLYMGCVLTLDDDLKIIRNQTAETRLADSKIVPGN